MSKDILFFEQWKDFNDSINDFFESRKLTKSQIKEFFEEGTFDEKYDEFLKKFISDNMNFVNDSIKLYHKEKIQEYNNNYEHMEQLWGEGFILYEFYIDSVSEFRNALLKYISKYYIINDSTEGIFVFDVINYLQGRALQIGNEILILLKNGYADAAYARFRTMYEISIVAHFISYHGDECAKSYIKYSGNWFDWAKEFLPKVKHKNITFNDIEKSCGVNIKEWKNIYKLSNKLIHASPQGTFFRFSIKDSLKEIPIGPIDSGIVEPATNSIISLFEINRLYFECIKDPIVNLWILTLQEIKRQCCEKFVELEKFHFNNNEEN